MKYVPRLFVLVLLLLASSVTYSETFIVTSNADSGPGTLREAIEKANANGTTITDFIHFNIADVTREGRTIVPLSEFPELSSNIVIDGTTQPGAPVPNSDAKIVLLINYYQSVAFTLFRMQNASNVEFYGLFLFNAKFTLFSSYGPVNGISFKKSSHIIIGKPGKGNYFRGLYKAVSSDIDGEADKYIANSRDIVIQSNIFNHNENGEPTIEYAQEPWMINPMEYAVYLVNAKDITIGGDDKLEGNYISARSMYIRTFLKTDNGFVIIKNNCSGTTMDCQPFTHAVASFDVTIEGIAYDEQSDYDVSIIDNKIHGTVRIAFQNKKFLVQGNTLYHESTSSGKDPKLVIDRCTGGGIIGGEQTHERNTIYESLGVYYNLEGTNLPHGSIHVYASPRVTIIKNTTICAGAYGSTIQVGYSGEPYVRIDHTETDFVSGKATPGCKIEVFKDDDCWACDGIVLLGQTVSNADSSWSFSGNFTGTVIATATNPDGSTSGYTEPMYNASDMIIQQPTCGLNNGAVSGIKLMQSVDNVEWHKVFMRNNSLVDTIVARSVDIDSLGPGGYYFIAKLGETCRSGYFLITLRNYTPQINETFVTVKNPSCGQANGSIEMLSVADGDFSTFKWINESGTVLEEGKVNGWHHFYNLPDGKYRMIVTDTIAGCSDSTQLFTLANLSGPSLNIASQQIVGASCGGPTGSIKGVTVNNGTGSFHVAWVNSVGHVVGNNFDLVDQPPGKYRLKYKDEGACDTIITPYFTIPAIGAIAIDMSGKQVWTAGCTVANGMIAGITVSGANNLQWKNVDDNSVVGNALTAEYLKPGNYQLTATNQYGCTKVSAMVNVPMANFVPIQPANPVVKNAACGQNNGSIQLTGFGNQAALASYKWVNSNSGEELGSQLSILQLGEGSYELVAIDTNGCQKTIFEADVMVNAKPQIDKSNIDIVGDKCDRRQATISGLQVNGLANEPDYTWKDANGATVGTSIDLVNVGEGEYQLTVKDGEFCTVVSDLFIVTNDNSDPLPQYDDQIVPRNTATTLKVNNYKEGRYRLYADATGLQLLEENSTGIFSTKPLTNDQNFYVQHILEACVSAIGPVKITVVDKSEFAVPNAFTPNGDELNDVLHARVLGLVNLEYFKIFNRFGKEVFVTKNPNVGWDGSVNGVAQPGGVYIWMAKGKDLLGNPVESKGTVVLIR